MTNLKILEKLYSSEIGFSKSDGKGISFLTSYHYVDNNKYNEILIKGNVLAGLFKKINSLYKAAIKKNQTDLLCLLESGFLHREKAKMLHRELFLDGRENMPLIFRGDTPDLNQFVEFHAGFLGLGLLYAYRDAIEKYWEGAGLFNRSRMDLFNTIIKNALLSNSREVVFLKRPWRDQEISYFIKKIFSGESINMKKFCFLLFENNGIPNLQFKQLYTTPIDFYMIRIINKRRFNLDLFIQKFLFNRSYGVMKRSDRKKIVIEPPPNLLYEQKIPMAIVRDEKYRDFFTNEERNLFPETHVIKRDAALHFNGRNYSLSDIIDIPRGKRDFIVKYAGLDPWLNWGSRSVYRLKMISKKQVETLFSSAALSYERFKEPWIIQNDISCKENINYFDIHSLSVKSGEVYKLYRPYFIYRPDKNCIDVLDIFAFFRNNFKVHAGENSVMGLVSVK